MTDAAGGPVLGPTLAEWVKAREETRRHLLAGAPPILGPAGRMSHSSSPSPMTSGLMWVSKKRNPHSGGEPVGLGLGMSLVARPRT